MQLSPIVSYVFSSIVAFVYKPMKIPCVHLIPRSSSMCTACTTTYYRFFNIGNKLLKCPYVHLSLFHSTKYCTDGRNSEWDKPVAMYPMILELAVKWVYKSPVPFAVEFIVTSVISGF